MVKKKADKIEVGYCLAHIYGEVYVLIKYKILDIHAENVALEFGSFDEVVEYLQKESVG